MVATSRKEKVMAKYNVDFTGVGEGFTLPPEGEYICKVTGVELKDGSKAKYLNWTLTIGTGEHKGTKIYHMTSFAPNALFNLRNFMIACGNEVPKAAFQVNTDTCVGKVVGITLFHEEYTNKEGKLRTSAKADEVYRVVKGSNGWVRVDENKAATNVVLTPPPVEEEEIPFNLEDDEDEIDI